MTEHMEIQKIYNPKTIESKWYKFWEEKGFFHAKVTRNKKPYTIVIPPPNITGILTLGHVLNNTIQDIFIRWKRMAGYEACWIPGTDHAGIATQNVVEKSLAEKGLTKEKLGREEFIKKMWEWKEQYGGTIIKQLKYLGTSCDWTRERFTMDEGLSFAVRRVFVELYNKGLIYKGKYIVNWCPRCRTALSDDEVEYRDHDGNLWYVKYPIADSSDSVTVATTRPETMLGDTAVAVNPSDERYKDLINKEVVLPLTDRKIRVIADNFVDPQFGTGIVKVTPAHDPNDFQIGLRHNLRQITVMDETGKMNENAPEQYRGLDRYECRKKILDDLESQGLLLKTEKHTNAVGHCYRCNTVIEPYLSDQWFVKMKPLAQKALEVVLDKKIKFYPERWVKVYQHWMENIRDWCISRQLWWGHRIPVYYCVASNAKSSKEGENTKCPPIVSMEHPDRCPNCSGTDIVQDSDVLDTWFSSWLWPFSTLGWPKENEDLKYFYPTNTLVTGPDIIFFWVARMIMSGLEFMDDVPFRDVYFTSIVRDIKGRKMSKSLGNSPDPLDIIDEYGADALRFTIVYLAPTGQDVLFSKEKCEIGRNLCNKIWNATRYILMNLEGFSYSPVENSKLANMDKWILNEYNLLAKNVHSSLERFNINETVRLIYDFFWSKFCDWYIELTKPKLSTDSPEKIVCQTVLVEILAGTLELLHPIMPFITEEIYQLLKSQPGDKNLLSAESIMVSPFPEFDEKKIFPEDIKEVELIIAVIQNIRTLRTELNVPPKKLFEIIVRTNEENKISILEKYLPNLRLMAKVDKISRYSQKPLHSAVIVLSGMEIYVILEGIIDIEKETARLKKTEEELNSKLMSLNSKLENEKFITNAPKDQVEKIKLYSKETQENITRIRNRLASLQ